jgi:hypothetical protein
MRSLLFLVFLLVVLLSFASASNKFDLACTFECTSYWTCVARGVWKGSNIDCRYPNGCECRKFALSDEQEQVFADSVINMACTEDCDSYAQCVQNDDGTDESQLCDYPSACRCALKGNAEEAESDLPFNLGCTTECTAYWACKARGAWNGNISGCNLPRGCECRKFFWQ